MLYGGPCCSSVEWGGGARTNNRLPCLLSPWWGSEAISFLTWGDGWRGCPGVQSQGGLGGPPSPPPVVLSAGGMRSSNCLFLPQTLQKWQLGFFCLSLYLLVQNFPQLHMQAVFLVPCSFFVSCCWKRGVSRSKQCAKGCGFQLLACLKE